MPDTVTGVLELVVVLFPSWPEPLNPQHRTVPLASSAHVCDEPPEEIAIAVEMPPTVTGPELSPMVGVPS
jgi:hypothetical protein